MHTNLISGLIHATIAAPGGGKNVHRIILGSQKILLLPVPWGGGVPRGSRKCPKKMHISVNISLGTGLHAADGEIGDSQLADPSKVRAPHPKMNGKLTGVNLIVIVAIVTYVYIRPDITE